MAALLNHGASSREIRGLTDEMLAQYIAEQVDGPARAESRFPTWTTQSHRLAGGCCSLCGAATAEPS